MNVLVTWLWQGALVAGIAALIVRACPRANAATRYALWWAALLMIGALPIVAPTLSFVHAAMGPATHATTTLLDPRQAAPDAALGLALPRPPFWLLITLVATWAALVLMRLAQIVHGLAAMTRVKRASHPLEPVCEHELARWSDARRTGRRCDLRVSDHVRGACVVGLRRPAILLPAALLRALSPDELDQVVLHEHAHVVRYDDWSRFAQCLLTTVLGVHPAVWAISRRIDLERETACDDRVIARTRAAREYAACLARAAAVRLAGSPREPLVVPAATRSRHMLRARIVRLLDREAPATVDLGWISATLGLTALGAAMVAAGLVPAPVRFLPRAAAVLEALPSVGLRWHAALPDAQASDAIPTAGAIPIADGAGVNATQPDTPLPADQPRETAATDDVSDERASDDVPRPAVIASTSDEAAATRASLLSSDTMGADLSPASLAPLQAHPIASQPIGRSLSLPDGSAFAAFGEHAARAGVALGTHLQEMGGNLGGWFARVSRGVSPP